MGDGSAIALIVGGVFVASGLWEYRWLRRFQQIMESRPLNDAERPRYNSIRFRPHVFVPFGLCMMVFGLVLLVR